jgi:hypothetical protein
VSFFIDFEFGPVGGVCIPALTILGAHQRDFFALPQSAVYDDGYYYFCGESSPVSPLATATSARGMLGVIDVSIPEVIYTLFDGRVWTINDTLIKHGDYLYVATVTDGTPANPPRLTVLDVSTPATPTIVFSASNVDEPDIGTSGIGALYAHDDHLYCYAHTSRLTVFDISNPLAPVSVYSAVDSTNIPSSITELFATGNHLYITTSLGHGIWDISTPSSPSHIKNVGSMSRKALDIVQDGDLLWFSGGGVVGSIDISTPADAFTVGNCDVPNHGTFASRFAKSGNYGVVISNSGTGRLSVVDLTNRPRQLETVGELVNSNLSNAIDVELDGTWAYVMCNFSSGPQNRFVTVDISTPTAPVIGAAINLSLTLINPGLIHKAGNYVYVPHINNDQLTIINVTTPTAPVVIGSVTNATTLNAVAGAYTVGNFCYLTSTEAGGRFAVVNVSNPALPTITASMTGTGFGPARSIIVSGNYAYIGRFSGGISVIDVSTPSSPAHVATLAVGIDSVESLAISGNTLFVIGSPTGFGGTVASVDISTPSAPVLLDSVEHTVFFTDGHDIAIDGSYAYTLGVSGSGTSMASILALDVSSPSDLCWVGNLSGRSLADDSIFGGSIAQLGNTLYVGSTARTLVSSVDITDPDCPTHLDDYVSVATHDGHAIDVGVDADGVYLIADDIRGYAEFNHSLSTITESLGDSTSGVSDIELDDSVLWAAGAGYLSAIDVSDPQNPADLSWFGFEPTGASSNSNSLAILGSHAFVSAGSDDSLHVFDISTPTDVQYVTSMSLGGSISNTHGLEGQGSHLYLHTDTRLIVINVSNPAAPSITTTLTNAFLDGGNRNSIFIEGTLAYVVAQTTSRLLVIDISTPASPSIIGNVQNTTSLSLARCVIKDGNYCYVGTGATTGRLTAVNVTFPTTPAVAGSLLTTNLGIVSALVKDGNFIYCSNANAATDRVTVVNVTTPGAPTLHSSVLNATYLNTSLDMVRVGDLMYVIGGGPTFGWLTIVDGACLDSEVVTRCVQVLGSVSTGDNLVGVAAYSNRVVTTQFDTDTIHHFNTAVPSSISVIDTIAGSQLNQLQHIAIDEVGAYAFTVRFGNVMQIVDLLTDYPNMQFPIGGGFGAAFGNQLLRDPFDIAYENDFVYVTCNAGNDVPDSNNGRMTIIDVSDRTTPVLRGTVYDYLLQGGGFQTGNHLTVQGDYVYVAAESTILGGRSLVIIDVSDKDNPVIVGSHTDVGSSDIYNVVVEGDYAYLTWGSFFYVYDVSNKTAPARVASVNIGTRGNGTGLVKLGDYCYFTSFNGDSVAWVNVANPLAPTFDTTLNVLVDETYLDQAGQMATDGAQLYVVTQSAVGRLTVLSPCNV